LTTGIVGNLLFSGCEENKKEVKITQDKEEALKKDIPAEYDTINKQVKSITAEEYNKTNNQVYEDAVEFIEKKGKKKMEGACKHEGAISFKYFNKKTMVCAEAVSYQLYKISDKFVYLSFNENGAKFFFCDLNSDGMDKDDIYYRGKECFFMNDLSQEGQLASTKKYTEKLEEMMHN